MPVTEDWPKGKAIESDPAVSKHQQCLDPSSICSKWRRAGKGNARQNLRLWCTWATSPASRSTYVLDRPPIVSAAAEESLKGEKGQLNRTKVDDSDVQADS